VRWALTLLVLATAASIALVAGGEPQRAPSACTWTGTPGRDVKTGNAAANMLCSLPGPDFIHGGAGNDVLKAGKGRDVAVGGGGRDVVNGGPGRDRLFIVDDRGGEQAYGGPGVDQCFIDPGDQAVGCETTFRSNEPEMASAFGQSLHGVMQIVELTPTPVPIPPPTVTVTVTDTVPPNCGGNPAPPPIC
jgi:RTX calcium-binding nonapeptide repeat (4 copies)